MVLTELQLPLTAQHCPTALGDTESSKAKPKAATGSVSTAAGHRVCLGVCLSTAMS